MLATGGQQGQIAVFDVASGRLLHSADRVHNEVLTQAEWLPDGRTVVTTGLDRMISLYDAQRGLVRVAMPASADLGGGYTYLISVSATDIAALSGAQPGRRYSLDPERWLDYACLVAGRDLTKDEWASYLEELPYRRTCTGRG
jgi:WD40 repeat protein